MNKNNHSGTDRIAIVRIRGGIDVKYTIKHALTLLRLYRANFCVVVPRTSTYLGLLNKIKDYVTYGEINEETFNLLVEKRGEEYKGRETDRRGKITYSKFIIVNNKKYKPFFRLNPPKGGFERKGIKTPFNIGGALGNRKQMINDLIKRMI
jgi:large subunit ribosomal protein L30